ncbi:MAG: hypothetical protein PVJ01_02430 [Pseudomonadota bacterium]|jgi:hypothetical protein
MQHTFLLKEGHWEAEGVYRGPADSGRPAGGYTTVTHGEDVWRIEGELVVGEEGQLVIRNSYEIEPWRQGGYASSWHSVNPAFGLLLGMFAVVDDTILTRFISEDGEYSGVESIRMVDAGTYESRGALFKRNLLASSWFVTLTKQSV